jgi:hypothetical protein
MCPRPPKPRNYPYPPPPPSPPRPNEYPGTPPYHPQHILQPLPPPPLAQRTIQLHKILHHQVVRPIHPVLIDHLVQKLPDHRLVILRIRNLSLSPETQPDLSTRTEASSHRIGPPNLGRCSSAIRLLTASFNLPFRTPGYGSILMAEHNTSDGPQAPPKKHQFTTTSPCHSDVLHRHVGPTSTLDLHLPEIWTTKAVL